MHDKSIQLLETSAHHLDRYPWEGNFPPPMAGRPVRRFQDELNRICGLAPNGKPNVRLIWPADPDESISMHIQNGEKRARYTVYSQEYECQSVTESGLVKVEIVTVDITPARWMLEDYNESTDTYLHLKTLGYHDERCCEGSESVMGQLCYGLYREPQVCDLEDLQRRIKEREAFGERVYTDQPLTYAEQQAGLQRIRNWDQYQRMMVKNRYKEAIVNGFTPQAPRLFSDDPTVQRWGKYHLLGAKHSKSGA